MIIASLAHQVALTVHRIDLAILDGATISPASMSALDLRRAEDSLRRLADQLADRRLKLLTNDGRQAVLPFRQAAE